MSKTVIVLVIGDVDGHFKNLFKKMKSVTKKLGNVAMAICVGNFFSSDCHNEWQQVLNGELIAPTQIFILGPTSKDTEHFYPDGKDMVDLTERITYLGKSGIFCTAEGLKLAYASGTFSELDSSKISYSYQDINKIINDTCQGRADMLLTWSWPTDFGAPVNKEYVCSNNKEISSSFLFSYLSPQYHVAAREKKSFEMAVERYYDDGTSAAISRFIGLSCLHEDGVKWIKALNITPYSSDGVKNKKDLKNIVPLQIEDLTEFSKKLHIKKDDTTDALTQYFFSSSNRKRQGNNKNRQYQKLRKTEDQPCWFCLSSPKVEKHMIISIGEHTFLALAKGPIVDDHILITTIHHRQSMSLVEDEIKNEVDKFKKALRALYRPGYLPVFYERSFRTTHLQIHCVPIPVQKYEYVASAYKSLAQKYDLNVQELKNKMSPMSLPEDEPYFHADLNDENELIIRGSIEIFPLNFGREALANLLAVPERKVWQKCRQSKEEEIKLVNEFKRRFKSYDFTE